jgi:hypothetical protein
MSRLIASVLLIGLFAPAPPTQPQPTAKPELLPITTTQTITAHTHTLYFPAMFVPPVPQIVYLPLVLKPLPRPINPNRTWQLLFHIPQEGDIPTSITEASDGTIYFSTKRGKVFVYAQGEVNLLVDLSDEVSSVYDRGLNAIAVTPDGRYLYLLYLRDAPQQIKDVLGYRDLVLVRMSTNNPQWRGFVLKDIPSNSYTHTAGLLKFRRGSQLFVGIGDDADGTGTTLDELLNPQHPDSAYGKVLLIDSETGDGLPTNPFWDGDAKSMRSRVYAMGFRNPFSGYYDAAADVLYVGEVGGLRAEEVNRLLPGGNYGWPCREGPHIVLDVTLCKDKTFQLPLHWYPHSDCQRAITGVVPWQGQYIMSDYTCDMIFNSKNQAVFEKRFAGITNMLLLSNGDLAVLEFGGTAGQRYGSVWMYTGQNLNEPPPIDRSNVYSITVTKVTTNTYAAVALAANGDDYSNSVRWSAVVHHDTHIHGDFATGYGKTIVLDRASHPDGWIELCAAVESSSTCTRVQ